MMRSINRATDFPSATSTGSHCASPAFVRTLSAVFAAASPRLAGNNDHRTLAGKRARGSKADAAAAAGDQRDLALHVWIFRRIDHSGLDQSPASAAPSRA